jgi:chloramphenicol-sensitive protein RarD
LISINWFVFVWAVSSNMVLEASLGYFINPLISVALGALVLGEVLNRPQKIAVGLATLAVFLLSVQLGAVPWVSLVLAGTFGLYGLIRKVMPVSALQGHFAETLACVPFALAYLIWMARSGDLVFGADLGTDLLLMLAGPVTAVPLMLFALAARRINLSTLGLTQYLAPTGHFLLAVIFFSEPFTLTHGLAFGLIWIGLFIFSMDSIRRERSRRKQLGQS